MSADTNPGGGFPLENLKTRVLALPEVTQPVQGIEVSQLQRIRGTSVTKQYLIAKTGNPWGYEEGVYMVTNLLPSALEKQKGELESMLACNALLDLLPTKIGKSAHESSLIVAPRYLGPGGGVIFQITGPKDSNDIV